MRWRPSILCGSISAQPETRKINVRADNLVGIVDMNVFLDDQWCAANFTGMARKAPSFRAGMNSAQAQPACISTVE